MKRTVIPRPGHTAVCFSPRTLQGRGIYRRIARGWTRQPRHTFGRATARQDRCGSRQATRRRRVDFSVARRVCRSRRSFAALLRNDSSAVRARVSIHGCAAPQLAGTKVWVSTKGSRQQNRGAGFPYPAASPRGGQARSFGRAQAVMYVEVPCGAPSGSQCSWTVSNTLSVNERFAFRDVYCLIRSQDGFPSLTDKEAP
jgi:hypothetical protein